MKNRDMNKNAPKSLTSKLPAFWQVFVVERHIRLIIFRKTRLKCKFKSGLSKQRKGTSDLKSSVRMALGSQVWGRECFTVRPSHVMKHKTKTSQEW
jgi:hypothetical protein